MSKTKDINTDEFKIDCLKLTNKELLKRYNISPRTLRRWKAKNRDPFSKIEDSEAKVYDDYINLSLDKFIVIGDVEIPNHSSKTLNLALSIARNFGIKDLIINGDFVALDCFSQWARSQVYKMAFKDELEPAVEIIKVFLNHFDNITWITGNHERRLCHKLDGHISIGDFFSNFGNVNVSEYSYCLVNSGGKDILVTHQQNYSKKPLAVPYEIAAIKLKNVIAAHTHHLSFGYDRSGKYWIVDGGHCRNQDQTRYKNINVNTHPEWNAGFCFVVNGFPHLVDHNNSDFWLKVKFDE